MVDRLATRLMEPGRARAAAAGRGEFATDEPVRVIWTKQM
jgi:hypothetical protein